MTPPEAQTLPDPSDLRHVVRRVENGTVQLHAEALLNEASNAAPVIFLSEAEAPSSRWPQDLMVGVAQRSGGAIWFDTRDCGRSTWLDEPYDITDLLVDVLLVLDAFGVHDAHVLGRSMGGQIAQHLALGTPDRVRSLTLLSSSPGRRDDYGLPEEWLLDNMTERLFADPPTHPDDQAAWLVEQQEWFAGPVFEFDRAFALAAATREVAAGFRGPSLHGTAVVDAPDIADHLRHIDAPTLVIHGTADPVFPVAHGQGLAERIPNSQLVLVEGLGHELPSGFVGQLIELLSAMVDPSPSGPRSS